jgi:L-cysteine:1D-myo-inositol 2-amino-2-deoxy-alpha-D-glucopyranoside ligase
VIRLYDTASRAVQPLVTGPEPVRLYVCGITPYDGGHLGHAFTYHTFDVLTRRLLSLGARVRSVRNVTDVDDEMMRVSAERGIGWRELADTVVGDFDRDMAAIGILEVSSAPRASRHVPAMIDWISRLVSRGFAYEMGGWVYFEVARVATYGELSQLGEADMIRLSRERGANPDDPRKRAPLDFVLWQPSRPGEPAWASPWGMGRPGWHIECSVLASLELGTPVDVHGGGDDLVFPHHESEIAQASGAGISPYVRLWSHVAMVGYRGEKMSKSVGNLVFVGQLLERVPPATVRLLLAAHHHRSSWEYTESDLEAAGRRRDRYEQAARRRGEVGAAEAERWRRDFHDRIDDDLDTPSALRVADALAERLTVTAEAAGTAEDGEAEDGATLLGELLDLVGSASAVAPAVSQGAGSGPRRGRVSDRAPGRRPPG